MIGGGLVGMLFGIVNRLYLQNSQDIGSIYAFDVLGSSIGALTTCSVLLPVLGIQETTIFISLFLLFSLILLFTLRTRENN
jgi:predicted membrane-bound spermidine synthase